MVDPQETQERKPNIIGLVAAALFVVAGIGMARESAVASMIGFGPALVLGIRSFLPGMTLGRGVLAAFGGMALGMLLVALLVNGFDDPASIVGPAILAVGGLWAGFERGPLLKKKKEKAQI